MNFILQTLTGELSNFDERNMIRIPAAPELCMGRYSMPLIIMKRGQCILVGDPRTMTLTTSVWTSIPQESIGFWRARQSQSRHAAVEPIVRVTFLWQRRLLCGQFMKSLCSVSHHWPRLMMARQSVRAFHHNLVMTFPWSGTTVWVQHFDGCSGLMNSLKLVLILSLSMQMLQISFRACWGHPQSRPHIWPSTELSQTNELSSWSECGCHCDPDGDSWIYEDLVRSLQHSLRTSEQATS